MRIAVLDDEPDMAELILDAAESLGSVGFATTDPEQFLAYIESGVDVVFLDLKMPGVDGVEILRRLSASGCKAELVLASGMERKVLQVAEDLARGLNLHTLGHLEKPFRLASIADLLSRAGVKTNPPQPKEAWPEQVSLSFVESAAREGRVIPLYQLKVDLGSGKPVGCEVLMRLRNAAGTLTPPFQFIPLAEESGLMAGLTDALLEGAFSEFAQQAPSSCTLSFNVSPGMLADLSLPDRFWGLASNHGLSQERITVEITETGLIENQSLPLDILARMRIKGFGVSIDDYGTGFSTLSHLRRFPATELKIDQMFVREMLAHEGSRSLVRNTIALGHDLGLKVVAEGIEEQGQKEALSAMECDVGQGYCFSRPESLSTLVLLDGRVGAQPK